MLIKTYSMKRRSNGALTLPGEFAEIIRSESGVLGHERRKVAQFVACFGKGRGRFINLFTKETSDIVEAKVRALPSGSVQRRLLERLLLGQSVWLDLAEGRQTILPHHLLQGEAELTLCLVNDRATLISNALWQDIAGETDLGRMQEDLAGIGLMSRFELDQSRAPFPSAARDIATAVDYLQRSGSVDWRMFEHQVAEIFEAKCDGIVRLTQGRKDGGIDVALHITDEKGFLRTLYVQCKSGERRATVSDIRELIGIVARDGCEAGILVSMSGATTDAERESRVSKIPVAISRLDELARWIERSMRQWLN